MGRDEYGVERGLCTAQRQVKIPQGCECVMEMLARLLDNEISDGEFCVLSRHIANCAPCSEVFDGQYAVRMELLRAEGERLLSEQGGEIIAAAMAHD